LIKVEVVTAVLGHGVGLGQGSVSGRARVAYHGMDVVTSILGRVAPRTSADFVEAIRKASGIVTEEESLTSHAAVIGLRLGIPVIVGVKQATKVIRDGAILTWICSGLVIYPCFKRWLKG